MRVSKLVLCVSVLLSFSIVAPAQQSYGPSGTPANALSVPVSYGFINANGGNLHLEIPLVAKNTRGSVPFTAKLVYDSANVYRAVSGGWTPATGTNIYGGWTLKRSSDSPAISDDGQIQTPCGGNGAGYAVSETGSYMYDADGTYHHFSMTINFHNCDGTNLQSFQGGAPADDDSGYYMYRTINVPGSNPYTVWNRSGIQVYPTVQDTNGNSYGSDGSGNVTDPTGATPFIITPVGSSEVDYKYYDSSAPGHQSIIKVALESSNVCTDFSGSTPQYCGQPLTTISSIAFASGDVVAFGYAFNGGAGNGGLNSITVPQGGVESLGESQMVYSSRTLGSGTWNINNNGSTITVTKPAEPGEPGSAKTVYTMTAYAGTNWQSQVQSYNADGTIANTTQTTWTSTTPVRPTQVVTTPASGSSTTTTYGYDANNSVTSVKTWDFGAGTNGTPLSDVETTYATISGNSHVIDHPATITINGNTGWGTNGQAAQTKYFYDANGNATSIQRWNSDTSSMITSVSMTYDAYGNPLTIKDALNNQTSITYECSNSYPNQTTRPNTGVAHIGSVSHDCNTGLVLSSKDENNNTTTYSYDTENRPLIVSYPGGGQTNYAYSAGSTTTTVKQNATTSIVTRVNRDNFGRSINTVVTDAEGNDIVQTTYDNNGRVACVTNPYRNTSDSTYGQTCNSYDGLNRAIKTTLPDGNVSTVQFSGACSTAMDAAGRSTQRCSDAVGHLTQVTEPNESTGTLTYVTAYTYDILGNLLSVNQKGSTGTQSSWRTRTFTYNSLSLPKSMTMPESGTTTYVSYDNNGNLLQLKDARGITTTLAYDALNRLTSKMFSDSTKPVYIYYDQSSNWGVGLSNPVGQVTTIYRGNPFVSGTIYSHDAMGRIVGQWDCRPSNCGASAFSTQYAYDLAGNLTSMTYPSGRVVTYGYNAANAPTAVTFASIGSTSVNFPYMSMSSHYPDGSPSAIAYGNGVTDTITLNNRLQRTGYKLVGTQTWLNRTFGYTNSSSKNDGNLWSVTDQLRSGGNQTFAYDYLNRLTSASQNDGAYGESFTYDPWSNLKQSGTYSFQSNTDTNNRISDAGFSYDAAGNLTAEGTTNHTFTYDAEEHLSAVDSTAATYTYGADGLRHRKDVGSTHTEYIYQGTTAIAELNESGDWTDYIMTPAGRSIKAEGLDRSLHIYGTNCSSCGSQYSLFNFPSAGGFSGYTIRSGDKLFLLQYQGTGSKGGIVVGFTDGSSTNWSAKDTSGYYANDDQSQLTTHSRTIDLSSFAGKTISNIALNSESDTAAGSWFITYEQVAMVSSDGTVRPLYTGQSSSPLQAGTGSSGVTGRGSTVDFNRGKAQYPSTTTTYYHTDGVGTARMITQGGGWPVWQGTFGPFGQEISPQISIDNNKFGTYQRETESNLDYAVFRRYAAVQGRFSTPDPYLGSADPANPQTWNRYAYAGNNPVAFGDPTGMDYCGGNSPYTTGGGGTDNLPKPPCLISPGVYDASYGGAPPSLGPSCSGWCPGGPNGVAWSDPNPDELEVAYAAYDSRMRQLFWDNYLDSIPADATDSQQSQSQTQYSCEQSIVNAGNSTFGTTFSTGDILRSYQHSSGGPPATYTWNVNISAGSQIGMVAPGRYPLHWWTYIIGYGATLHVPSGPGGLDSGLTVPFGKQNGFSEHIDNAYAGWNVLGDLFHLLVDVLGNGRNACPQ